MSSEPSPEPDERGLVIDVGQDKAGHWLVQDDGQTLEGRFVPYPAAMSHARAEHEIYHVAVAISPGPLVPLISFARLAPRERVLPRAA